jgi:hypothetical protein
MGHLSLPFLDGGIETILILAVNNETKAIGSLLRHHILIVIFNGNTSSGGTGRLNAAKKVLQHSEFGKAWVGTTATHIAN